MSVHLVKPAFNIQLLFLLFPLWMSRIVSKTEVRVPLTRNGGCHPGVVLLGRFLKGVGGKCVARATDTQVIEVSVKSPTYISISPKGVELTH